jgi:uncharacterized protein
MSRGARHGNFNMLRISIAASLLLVGRCIAADPPVTIPNTEQWDMQSNAGLDYRIFVGKPFGKPPEAGCPVIYLTDANLNFLIIHAAVQRLRTAAVVVGIGYPGLDFVTHHERRAFDLTSTQSEEFRKKFPPGGPVHKTGGNDQFLTFIEEELKPRVEKRFTIDKNRQAFFGHSLGGLFAMHVLFNKPSAFQTYIASSPSLWWNDNDIRKEETAFVAKYTDKGVKARLFISVGGLEQKTDTDADLSPAIPKLRMISNAQELADRMNASKLKGLSVSFREFPDEDHASVLLPAANRGVRYALDGPGT